MTPYSSIPLIIADGDFPTTRLVARELGVVHGQVEIRIPDSLFGAELAGRQVVISRLCQPFLSWLPDYFSQRGLRYAYLLDDNFWELPPEMDEVVAPFYNHPAVLATLERYVRGAAVVIVWSERMRQYLVDRFPRSKVEMVPCGVDLEQIERMRPQSSAAHEDVIRIGYPTSRRPGVAALLTEIVRMLGAKYAHRVQFEFMGWMPETLEGLPNVTLTPQIAEYDRYLQFVCARQWDIGLAPRSVG